MICVFGLCGCSSFVILHFVWQPAAGLCDKDILFNKNQGCPADTKTLAFQDCFEIR